MATNLEAIMIGVGIDPSLAKKGSEQVKRYLKETGDSANKLGDDLEKSGKKGEDAFSRIVAGAKQALKAFIAFKATKEIAGLIKESTLLAARYETLGVVLNTVGANAGYNAKQMGALQESVRVMGITMTESRQALIDMVQAHLDLTQASKLARLSQDAAVIAGINSSEAFNRIVYGLKSAEVRILRTIGLNVSFERGYKRLAEQLGVTVESLNETQRAQARLNEVMTAGELISGGYADAMNTAGKQLTSLPRYIEDAKVKFGELFGPAFHALILSVTDALVSLNKQLDDIDGRENAFEDWVNNVAYIREAFMDIYYFIRLIIASVKAFGDIVAAPFSAISEAIEGSSGDGTQLSQKDRLVRFFETWGDSTGDRWSEIADSIIDANGEIAKLISQLDSSDYRETARSLLERTRTQIVPFRTGRMLPDSNIPQFIQVEIIPVFPADFQDELLEGFDQAGFDSAVRRSMERALATGATEAQIAPLVAENFSVESVAALNAANQAQVAMQKGIYQAEVDTLNDLGQAYGEYNNQLQILIKNAKSLNEQKALEAELDNGRLATLREVSEITGNDGQLSESMLQQLNDAIASRASIQNRMDEIKSGAEAAPGEMETLQIQEANQDQIIQQIWGWARASQAAKDYIKTLKELATVADAERYRKTFVELERQIELVGKTARESAMLTAKWQAEDAGRNEVEAESIALTVKWLEIKRQGYEAMVKANPYILYEKAMRELNETAGVLNLTDAERSVIEREITEEYEKQVEALHKLTSAESRMLSLAEERLSLEEELLNAKKNISEIDKSILQDSLTRQQIAIKRQEIAMLVKSGGGVSPGEELEIAKLRTEIAKLTGQIDELSKEFDNLYQDSIAQFIEDTLQGTKDIEEAFRDMVSNIAVELAKLANQDIASSIYDSIKSATGGKSLGQLTAGFLGSIFGGGASAATATAGVGPLASGYVKPGSMPALFDPMKALGFATGGSFLVGGSGGIDSQLVSFRATPGERVTINTPAQNSPMGGGITINFSVNSDNGYVSRETQHQIATKIGAVISNSSRRM